MPHTHALDRVHNALAPTALGRAVAGIVLPLRAPRIDGSAAAGAGAIFTKLAFASVLGLAFVIALPLDLRPTAPIRHLLRGAHDGLHGPGDGAG